MKLLANENVPAASIRVLKDAGFDIFSVGLECPGLSDPEVMELAIQPSTGIMVN